MPLKLLPWEEGDFAAYPEMVWAAFKDDLMQLLYPNGYSEEDRKQTARTTAAKDRARGETSVWMKTIDTDLRDDDPMRGIVGLSHWQFYPKQRSEAELAADEKDDGGEGPPPGLNRAFADEFFGNIDRLKREILGGRPYVLLHMLAVRPEYHRRGIGAVHLSWGSEQADKLGLPLYLEASPMGRPLYERHGYEKVADFPMDARAHGHPKDLPHVCMLRPAKGAQ